MIAVAKMLAKHIDNILAYLKHRSPMPYRRG
jgi:hypothetical protein